jgi:hypothetical protein
MISFKCSVSQHIAVGSNLNQAVGKQCVFIDSIRNGFFPVLLIRREKLTSSTKKPNMTGSLPFDIMDRRSIWSCLARNGLSALDISNEPAVVLSPEASADSTITGYLRQRHFPAIISQPADEPSLAIMKGTIVHALDK